jgi:hypothetical protein
MLQILPNMKRRVSTNTIGGVHLTIMATSVGNSEGNPGTGRRVVVHCRYCAATGLLTKAAPHATSRAISATNHIVIPCYTPS